MRTNDISAMNPPAKVTSFVLPETLSAVPMAPTPESQPALVIKLPRVSKFSDSKDDIKTDPYFSAVKKPKNEVHS
jgi:hypothetical protein